MEGAKKETGEEDTEGFALKNTNRMEEKKNSVLKKKNRERFL